MILEGLMASFRVGATVDNLWRIGNDGRRTSVRLKGLVYFDY